VVVALENQGKGSNAPSVRSLVMDEESLRSDWINAFCFFLLDTVGWMTVGTSGYLFSIVSVPEQVGKENQVGTG